MAATAAPMMMAPIQMIRTPLPLMPQTMAKRITESLYGIGTWQMLPECLLRQRDGYRDCSCTSHEFCMHVCDLQHVCVCVCVHVDMYTITTYITDRLSPYPRPSRCPWNPSRP